MRQRGRPSAASLQLASASGVFERIERPEAPPGMPEAQAGVWRAVTSSLEPEWFRPETLPLLAQYCRHVVAANVLATQIEELQQDLAAFEAGQVPAAGPPTRWEFYKGYCDLLAAQRQETNALVQLATKMRLSQQSTYDKSKRKPAVGARPWQ